MKKLFILGLTAGIVLTGCTSIQRTLRGDKYVDSSLAAQEKNKVLTDKNIAFPQLSTKIAKDEAEAKIITNKGSIRVKLFPKYAPLAVENFLTHAKEGYYKGISFHRVIKDFMIQTGDPKGDGSGGQSIWKGKDSKKDAGAGFKNEISPYLYHLRGALGMANSGPDTNGSQFFINQNPTDQSKALQSNSYPAKIIEAYKKGGNPSLDKNYTVFGQVIEGMDIVDQIASVETENNKPKEEIKIEKIEVLKEVKTSKK